MHRLESRARVAQVILALGVDQVCAAKSAALTAVDSSFLTLDVAEIDRVFLVFLLDAHHLVRHLGHRRRLPLLLLLGRLWLIGLASSLGHRRIVFLARGSHIRWRACQLLR